MASHVGRTSRALEAYAASGGSLLATFETGLYDETGKPRADFALASLFGISRTGPRQRTAGDKSLSSASVHLQEIQPAQRPHRRI